MVDVIRASRRRRTTLTTNFASLASLVILVLASPSPVQAATGDVQAGGYSSSNTACTRYYEVAPGDTCDKIGQLTFTSTYQIMAFNLPKAGPDCYTLEIGAQLCLGRYGNDCQLVHRAVDTETCDSIAAMYGIDLSTLETNNPSLDCQRVYDGLVLCVAPGIVRPPPPAGLNATAIAEAGQQHAAQEQTQQQQQFLVKAPQKSTPVGGVSAQSTPDPAHRYHSQHHNHHHHHHHATHPEERSSSKLSTRSSRPSSKHSSTSTHSSHTKSKQSTRTHSSSHGTDTSSTHTKASGSSTSTKTSQTAEVEGEQRPASSTSKDDAMSTSRPTDTTSTSKHKSTDTATDGGSKGHSTTSSEGSKASNPIQQMVDGVLDKLL